MSISLILPIFIGLLAGWMVNYFSDTLPITRRFSKPVCLECGASYSLKDYLLFQRCSNGHARGFRVWLAQILVVAASVYIWIQPPTGIGYIFGMLLILYFGVVVVIDMEHRLILHPTSIAGALLALTAGIISHGLVPSLLGGLGGFLIMFVFYYLGVLFTRFRAKRIIAQGQEPDEEEALGSGDVILVTILGFLVGWPLIWFCILLSIMIGGLASLMLVISLLITRKYEKQVLMTFIPYGPYFIISAFLITFFPRFLAMIVPG